MLMTDQHRADSLRSYGNGVTSTPAIDRLAESGTQFDRFYTPTAICTPARASLFTGMHPFRHGLLGNPERSSGLQSEIGEGTPVLSAPLLEAGYNVGHVGKWHIGRHKGPEDYGMDGEHLAGALNPFHHDSYLRWLGDRGYPPFAVKEPIFGTSFNDSGRGHLLAGRLQQPFEATMESFITDSALTLLERYGRDYRAEGTPFMLTCSWFGPHLPYLIPDEFYDMYDPDLVELPASFAETFDGKPEVQRRYSEYWSSDSFDEDQWRKLIAVYWGYVTMIDRCMGMILARVDESGLWDSTSVIFTADHGEFTGAHRLNDKGPAMYEDIYRIPGIIRVPGLPPQRRQEFASLIDLAPTILDLAGLEPLPTADGTTLVPLLAGGTPDEWPQHIVAEFHGHHFMHDQRMIRDQRFKYIFNPGSVNELYDLVVDPDELHNVYDAPIYREDRERLGALLYRELYERGDTAYTWMSYMGEVGDGRMADVDGVADQV
ncbi:sulfatase-like hydrolase/transferase [Lysinimonas soli]|uniref:Sulfatase-like hydrolase/transferase n=1 Tax=Lysinimonas soli TaxID=1074233 RepID=A0ABW0NUP9_9MICO